jgi:hypothetical protein
MAYSAEHTLAPPESRAAAHWCERTMLATLDGSSSSAAQEQTLGDGGGAEEREMTQGKQWWA